MAQYFLVKANSGQHQFAHKTDALKFMYEHDKTAELEVVYHPEVFDNIDWTKEPEESWEQLLDQYVIQCRLKYPKLALLWSGGSDSHTLYLAFKRNKIHLDQIIVTYDTDKTKGQEPAVIDWLYANCYDKTIDIKTSDCSIVTNDGNRRITNQFDVFKDLAQTVHDNFQVCVYSKQEEGISMVSGNQKPSIYRKNGKWYHRQISRILLNTSHVHNGFLDPDFPKIAVKQAHLAKRNSEQFLRLPNNWDSDEYIKTSWQAHALFAAFCGRHPGISINNIITQKTYVFSPSSNIFNLLKSSTNQAELDFLKKYFVNSPVQYVRDRFALEFDASYQSWLYNRNFHCEIPFLVKEL